MLLMVLDGCFSGGVSIWSVWINTIGLAFDIVGVLILFAYQAPPKINGMEDMMRENYSLIQRVKASIKDSKLNKFGISLIVLGFAMQIVSNFI